jgi:hypothetical protein
MKFRFVSTALIALAFAAGGVVPAFAAGPYLGPFHTVNEIASTIPGDGDLNPYGVAVVPRSIGNLVAGDILVSNFNNGGNKQGEGSTIVEILPGGTRTLFARIRPDNLHGACPGGVGLTTALVVLERGWVIVGSLPTSDGTSATMQAGCLIVLNSRGDVVETFADDGINGPWDMTARDDGVTAVLFVTNVLNGHVAEAPLDTPVNEGTILRINLLVPPQNNAGLRPIRVLTTVIASGFSEESDAAALVIGPTGLGIGRDGTLYVADAVNSQIDAIPNAFVRFFSANTGTMVTSGGFVNGPLGLAIAPNGDILTVNSGDGNVVETTPGGVQVAVVLLNNTPPVPTGGAGALFGLAVVPGDNGVYFVDDDENQLNILQAP